MTIEQTPEVKYKRKKFPHCWHCHKPLDAGVNNQVCPNCNSEFAEKPKNEAKYHILQKEYLETKKSETLGKILLLVEEFAYNIICGKLRSSGKFLDDEMINDKTSWVVEKMFKYYLKPDFYIHVSAIDYISQVCLYALFGHAFKKVEQNEISVYTPLSLHNGKDEGDQTILDHLSNETYMNNQWDIENIFYENIYKDNLVNHILEFMKEYLNVVAINYGFEHAFNLSQVIHHFFNNKNNRFISNWFQSKSGYQLYVNFEVFKIQLRNFFRNGVSVNS